jgi:two-component system NarL family sensor kinase
MLLPDAVNTALFRIAQEASTNIVRHARASKAALALDIAAGTVALTIEDDGRGFDIDRVQADPNAGVGLRNMRERLEALGGTLSVVSQPGHTVVRATVPVSARGNDTASISASVSTSTSFDASHTTSHANTRIAQEDRP